MTAILAIVVATGCGADEEPSTAPRVVLDAADVTVIFSPAAEGDTSIVSITNDTHLVLTHGGLAARVDIWNGREWAIKTMPDQSWTPREFLIKATPQLELLPGESGEWAVDVTADLPPGVHDLAMPIYFERIGADPWEPPTGHMLRIAPVLVLPRPGARSAR